MIIIMKVSIVFVLVICTWSAMSSSEEMVQRNSPWFISTSDSGSAELRDSFEANMTYQSDENTDYNVTVRVSDYYNILFYNLSYFEDSTREYKYEAVTYDFKNSLVSKYYSSIHYCSRSILGYDISHSIVKFANMLWGQNRIRVSQPSPEHGEVEVIYEIHLDDFTHFNAKGTKPYYSSPDACIYSIYGKFLGKHVTLNVASQFEYRMFSNMNLYSGACRPSID